MKHFIIYIICALYYFNAQAEEVNIPLQKDIKEDDKEINVEDDRSLFSIPTAFHNGSQIDIYSDKEMEKVNICIYDLHGNILFEQDMSNLIGSYSFQLNASTNELLILMITTTTDSYRGEFYLNE